jgi:hypothetical protein
MKAAAYRLRENPNSQGYFTKKEIPLLLLPYHSGQAMLDNTIDLSSQETPGNCIQECPGLSRNVQDTPRYSRKLSNNVQYCPGNCPIMSRNVQ